MIKIETEPDLFLNTIGSGKDKKTFATTHCKFFLYFQHLKRKYQKRNNSKSGYTNSEIQVTNTKKLEGIQLYQEIGIECTLDLPEKFRDNITDIQDFWKMC